MLSPENLDTAERQLADRSAALLKVYNDVEQRLANVEAHHGVAMKAALDGVTSVEERSTIRQVVEKGQRQELGKKRRQLIADSDEQRLAILSVVDKYEAEAEQTAGLYRSPVQVLARERLGDPKRGEYLNQLANAGPAELQSAADLAKATADRALASAVLTVADRGGPKRYSQFDKAAFAAHFTGAETEEMQVRLEEIRQTIHTMRELERTFRGTGQAKLTPKQKIQLGVMKKRLADRSAA